MSDELVKNLRSTLSKFELALGQIKEAILFTSKNGQIQWCNQVFDKIVEKPHIEILGQCFSELFILDKDDNILPLKQLQDNPGQEFTLEYHSNQSKNKIYQIYGRSLQGSDESISFVFVISDFTERKNREHLALQSQKLEAIGTLTAGIAHEMNTPIQFISDNILFLKESINDLTQFIGVVYDLTQKNESAEVMHNRIKSLYEQIDIDYLKSEVPVCLNQTQKGTKQIAKLVHSMKQFSHPGSKELSPVSLTNIVGTVLDVTKNTWKNYAELEVNIDKKHDQVYSIQSELNQILMNLIINARDAIVEKYGKDKKEGLIKIRNQMTKDFVELTVTDNGTGIPDEIIDKIFDPFFTTKEVGEGTGQGLAMIYHAVTTKLQGKVDVSTNHGEGTTFTISLPVSTKGL